MQERTLTIRFTSDTHGYLYPTTYADAGNAPLGLMRLAAEFPHDGNTLLLDGGDSIQGSPLTTLYHRLSEGERRDCVADDRYGTHPIAAMMNLAGYQFVTLGNHDFNNGLSALADYLDNLDALCLCANIRDRAGRLPIAPYAIHRLQNGLRVGLVGACTHYVSRWENPATVAELVIEDPVRCAAEALAAVRDRCDVTVLLYHGGFECDLDTGERLTKSEENQACRICRELDFDLVLTGHQHIPLAGRRFGNSYVVQPGYRAPHACAVTVTVAEDGTKRIESRLLPAGRAPLPEAAELLMPLERRVQRWLDEPAGTLDRALDVGDPLTRAREGSLLANFINTVLLDASGAQIASCSLGNDACGLPERVTVRDVVAAYVYTNTLLVLRLTGATLRRYVERTAAYFALDEHGALRVSDDFLRPKVQHYNYEFLCGMDYVIDVRRPAGDRVVSMKRNGREIEDGDEVSVCVSSYRACGTGGYEMLLGQRVERDIQQDVRDLIIRYILDHPNIRVDVHRYLTVLA